MDSGQEEETGSKATASRRTTNPATTGQTSWSEPGDSPVAKSIWGPVGGSYPNPSTVGHLEHGTHSNTSIEIPAWNAETKQRQNGEVGGRILNFLVDPGCTYNLLQPIALRETMTATVDGSSLHIYGSIHMKKSSGVSHLKQTFWCFYLKTERCKCSVDWARSLVDR